MFITLISHQNKCSLQRKVSSFTALQSFHFKGTKTIYASSAFFTAKDNTLGALFSKKTKGRSIRSGKIQPPPYTWNLLFHNLEVQSFLPVQAIGRNHHSYISMCMKASIINRILLITP